MDQNSSKELETIEEALVSTDDLTTNKEPDDLTANKEPETIKDQFVTSEDITVIEKNEREPLKSIRSRRLPHNGHGGEHVRFADVDVIEEETFRELNEEEDDDDDDDVAVGCEAIQQVAHRVAEQAEEFVRHVWKQGWKVVSHRSLPIWLKDNDFLVRGHRPELKSFRACFKSIFRIHTETGNIWTHLLGCVAFVGIFAYFMSRPSIEVQWQEKAVFSAFFCGAILCMGFSWLFHTVYCHSERIGRLFNKLDYCGIALLTMGSFVPWLYYSFYCQLSPKIIYLCLIIVLGSTCIIVSMWDKFAAPQYRPLRAGLFIGLGLSGVIPCVHYIIIEGFWRAVNYSSLGWLFLMAVLYITGAVIYAIRIPERLFPGKFDIWFQSHQIFHVFVVAAAFVHYHGISEIANYRLTSGDCSNPDSAPEMFSFVGT